MTSSTAALAAPLEASAKSLDIKVDTRTVDESAGRDQVAAGKLSALLVGDGSTVQVVVTRRLDPKLGNALQVLAGHLALHQQITALGGDPTGGQRRRSPSASVTVDVAHAAAQVQRSRAWSSASSPAS